MTSPVTRHQTFSDPCTPVMEAIVEVHAYIMFFLVGIVAFVSATLVFGFVGPPRWGRTVFLAGRSPPGFGPEPSGPEPSGPEPDPDDKFWDRVGRVAVAVGVVLAGALVYYLLTSGATSDPDPPGGSELSPPPRGGNPFLDPHVVGQLIKHLLRR